MSHKSEQLQHWLKNNVISPATPKHIVLSNITFDKNELNGKFILTLDNERLTQFFRFSVDISGIYQIHPPMHISPLGVPGSYASIELTEETVSRIEKLINDFFPKIKPLGIDETSGELIDTKTDIKKRIISSNELNLVLNTLSDMNFQLRTSIK